MNIKENIEHFRSTIPNHVSLCAVSKTKPNEDLMEAYKAGQRIFGENRVQEMAAKAEALPEDIQWHMIGHVQTNKVKYMAAFVDLIHSADRLKLFKEINKQAESVDRIQDVLLQVKIAEEESKYGMPISEAIEFLAERKDKEYPNVRVRGLMGMATFTDDQEQLQREFKSLQAIYERFRESNDLSILSMGMSGDYQLAIACGSNMIRVGSAIFGARK
ncbi:YggS family pyridoxal phosphate-dependent enzyme [Croceiramulus getboli]|nr:YggS family pyridoxal phosphate-dependent enzyme [Flavobacteriaceae bacterium YJPT1-3]